MRQSCRAGQPLEPPSEAEPPLPSLGLSTCRGLAIPLPLPLPGSPSTFPIRIPGTSAVPEPGCGLPWRDACVICKCRASFQKFLREAPKIPRGLMGAPSRAVLGAQGEGEGLCRAHTSCESHRCQGLEQMRLPWLLQPGSTWPPAGSRLCTGHEAPGAAPGSLNLPSGFGEPTSPDPTGSSRSSDPPSVQMTLMETRGLLWARSTRDSLESGSQKFPTVTSVPPPGSCCPCSHLMPCWRARSQASPWCCSGRNPTENHAPLWIWLFARRLQPCSCCSLRGFARECRRDPDTILLPWRQHLEGPRLTTCPALGLV